MSEVVGAMLAIGVTLVAGAAAWSFVRNQAGASEGALMNNAQGTNNYLGEHFSVVDMYFGTTSSTTFWVYNTGGLTFQAFSVRVFGSGGTINLYYNYTMSGGVRTEQVYDLSSSLASKCKTAAATYESPSLTATTVKTTNAQLYTLTIPPTQGSCPSFGKTWTSGHTYTVVVTGLYGNVMTFSQTD